MRDDCLRRKAVYRADYGERSSEFLLNVTAILLQRTQLDKGANSEPQSLS